MTAKLTRTEIILKSARRTLRECEVEIQTHLGSKEPLDVLMRHYRAFFPSRMVIAAEKALLAVQQAEFADLYGHKQGTPETYSKIDAVLPSKRQSPLARMFESGEISDDQWQAAQEIEQVAEMIERAVAVRGASLEARVDNSGAGRDVLVESLGRVRLEVTYSAWRDRLPMPRRMYLDMILTNQALTAIARAHGEPWRKARKRLLSALDGWAEVKEKTWKAVDAGDVEWIYARLGCGILLPPKPRQGLVIEDNAA